MKSKTTIYDNSQSAIKMAELMEQRKKEIEKAESRKRVMSQKLFSVIGDKKIIITQNSK